MANTVDGVDWYSISALGPTACTKYNPGVNPYLVGLAFLDNETVVIGDQNSRLVLASHEKPLFLSSAPLDHLAPHTRAFELRICMLVLNLCWSPSGSNSGPSPMLVPLSKSHMSAILGVLRGLGKGIRHCCFHRSRQLVTLFAP